MVDQLDAFNVGGAATRSHGAATSKAAAASVKLRASQARVLQMFKLYGDMTDEQLTKYLHEAEKQGGLKPMSPSGVRSRRSELTKPNLDRMGEMAREDIGVAVDWHDLNPVQQTTYRARLIVEGIKSPLWDTGVTDTLESGRKAIVWGLAR